MTDTLINKCLKAAKSWCNVMGFEFITDIKLYNPYLNEWDAFVCIDDTEGNLCIYHVDYDIDEFPPELDREEVAHQSIRVLDDDNLKEFLEGKDTITVLFGCMGFAVVNGDRAMLKVHTYSPTDPM